MKDPRKANAALVESLGSALRDGDHGLKTVPALLKRVLREESWRQFVTQRGELVEHDRFADFVTTLPLAGLGASVDLVRRMVAGDTEALDLLDQALQNPVGRPDIGSDEPNKEEKRDRSGRDLRRLRKDAPELHAEVLAGRLSAHAAMVEAGFRPKTFTVRPDPVSAAKALRKHLSPEARQELARLLIEEDE